MKIDGKKLSEKILKRVREKIKQEELDLKLTAALIGEDPVSKVYLEKKQNACEQAGIEFELFQFSAKLSEEELEGKLKKMANNKHVSGAMIQLPIPKNYTSQPLLNTIPPEKDADVLSKGPLGRFYTATSPIMPPTPKAIAEILKEYELDVEGVNVGLVGTGALVGYPLSLWLHRQKATVIAVNEFTKNPEELLQEADIIISGIGIPNTVTADMVKPGAVVIDAGTAFIDGKLTGDVDFKNVSEKASLITPTPGGVGPITVSCLLENLVTLNTDT